MASVNADLSSSTAYAEAIAMLIERGGTVSEVAEQSGMRYNTVRKLVRALHRRGVLRIALWKRDGIGRERLPVYIVGKGPDAVRPPGMTQAERAQRYWEQRRQIAERLGIAARNVRMSLHRDAA